VAAVGAATGALTAGVGSAAKAETATRAAIVAIICFIIISFDLKHGKNFLAYIYNASGHYIVDIFQQ
jgi:hypothetical protein